MSSSTNDFYLSKGDMIWVSLKGPDQNYGHGEVAEIWHEDSIDEECFGFHCLVNGGYRMGIVSNLIKKPSARMISKLLQSRKEYNEAMKEKR